MDFKPNKEQEYAIYSNGEILVSAAAGSGKTAVLVQRVIEKIKNKENPLPADKLLIVTFTNAAAAELRARINNGLTRLIAKEPENTWILKQQLLLNNAFIGTIDSFCIKMCRNYFNLLNINQDFDICAGTDEDIAILNTVNEIFFEKFEENNEDFLYFIDNFNSDFDDSESVNAVTDTYKFISNLENPKEFLQNSLNLYKKNEYINLYFKDKNFDNYKKADYFYNTFLNLYNFFCENTIKNLSDICLYAKDLSLNFKKAFKSNNYTEIINTFNGINNDFSVSVTKKTEETALFKETFKQFKKYIKNITETYKYSLSYLKEENLKQIRILNVLVDLLNSLEERLLTNLNKQNMLTYNFCERFTLELLQNKELGIKNEIISMFKEVMVDEYQDVNDLQDKLFYLISNNGKHLFTVGDMKQCIYRFRGSNPFNFKEKCDTFKEYGKEENLKINGSLSQNTNELEKSNALNLPRKIYLAKNYRSRKEICDFINYFFKVNMSEKLGDINYGENEKLVYGANYADTAEPKAEVDFINNKSSQKSNIAEAEYIAQRILNLINKEPFLKDKNGGLRKAEFRDFAVILRSDSGRFDEIGKIFKKYNIPCGKGKSFPLLSNEVITVIDYLKVLINPNDDISLTAALTSVFFNFTLNEIYDIKQAETTSLYSGLILNKNNPKVSLFLNFYKKHKYLSSVLSCYELIETIINDFSFKEIIGFMTLPDRRNDNLNFLCEKAKNFKDNVGGLYAFLRYLEKSKNDAPTGNGINKEQNTVKILTMHGSKGLQFPICFIASNASAFNNVLSREVILKNKDYGIGFKCLDEIKNVKRSNIAREFILDKCYSDELSEAIRLYYVALTRAEEKLILTVCKNDIDKDFEKFAKETEKLLNENLDSKTIALKAKSFKYWIYNALYFNGYKNYGKIPPKTENSLKYVVNFTEFCGLKEIKESKDNNLETDEKTVKEIINRFNYRYPFKEIAQLQSKTTVTDIVESERLTLFDYKKIPEFGNTAVLSGAQYGTVMHKLMQYLNFKKAKENLDEEFLRLKEYLFLTEEELNAVKKEQIIKFLNSKTASRILNAEKCYKEYSFLTEIPATELNPAIDKKFKDEMIVVQGAIDCLFIEKDKTNNTTDNIPDNKTDSETENSNCLSCSSNEHIVILDFKTDKVKDETTLLNNYSEQLKYYAFAVSKIFKIPVKECYLYSFNLEKEILVKF